MSRPCQLPPPAKSMPQVGSILDPRPGYVPKVTINIARSTIMQDFYFPPFVLACQEKLNLFAQLGSVTLAFIGLPSGISVGLL